MQDRWFILPVHRLGRIRLRASRYGGQGPRPTSWLHALRVEDRAFALGDLPARVCPPPPTPEAWQRVAGG